MTFAYADFEQTQSKLKAATDAFGKDVDFVSKCLDVVLKMFGFVLKTVGLC